MHIRIVDYNKGVELNLYNISNIMELDFLPEHLVKAGVISTIYNSLTAPSIEVKVQKSGFNIEKTGGILGLVPSTSTACVY